MFVALAMIVAGVKTGPVLGLLIVATIVAAIWQYRLSARHHSASACGTSGGDPPKLFSTAFWLVFTVIILCPPTVFVLCPVAFLIRTH